MLHSRQGIFSRHLCGMTQNGHISINLEQLKDEPPETAYEFKVFGVRTQQKKLKKGIVCSSRMQQVSKVSPARV